MVKITVVIPVYNSARFLRKCLDSVCGQTLREIEIICINDASRDESLSILQEYAAVDQRIKLIDFKENKGAAIARNIGIENACGKYLGFVDSDDFIDLNFYEKLYAKSVETNADAVKANIAIYCPQKKSRTDGSWIDINDKVKRHQANFSFSFTSAIYRRSFVEENSIKFLEGLIHFEDPYFTIKAALFYKRLEVIDDVFYYYVENPNSASRKNFSLNHIESLIVGSKKVLDLLDQHCVDKDHYIIVFNFLFDQFFHCCDRIDVGDEVNIKAVSGLFLLYERCKHANDCAIQYFLQKKKKHKTDILKQLRNKVKNDFKSV